MCVSIHNCKTQTHELEKIQKCKLLNIGGAWWRELLWQLVVAGAEASFGFDGGLPVITNPQTQPDVVVICICGCIWLYFSCISIQDLLAQ